MLRVVTVGTANDGGGKKGVPGIREFGTYI